MDNQYTISKSLGVRKEGSSLSVLKSGLVSGIFAEQERKKKEKKVKMLLENALFLEHDEGRKKRWISILSEISNELLEDLIQAILRENIRYKKKERNIVAELNKKSVLLR